jgi:Domain of unknown function (DUF4160)
MPVISSFYGILIKMYFGDHVPPHFHAEYNEYSAQVSISDFQLIRGTLPPKALALVMEWASLHQTELMANWNNLSKVGPGTFKKIEPLK